MSQITRLVRNWSRWVLLSMAVVWPVAASAQLDPLLMIKRNQPNVIFVVDTSSRMLKDVDNNYYDPNTYTKTGALWEGSPGLGVTNTTTFYRRIYNNLVNTDLGTSGSDKFTADAITAIGDQHSEYAVFWSKTRREIARLGLLQAVKDNKSVARFGLIKTRQNSPAWGTEKNDDPVVLLASNLAQKAPTEMTSDFKWKITRTTVGASNGSISSVQSALILADASGASAAVQTKLELGVGASGGLIPAGRDAKSIIDSPVDYMLKDAKAEAARLIAADGSNCRNTIVVLVVGGGEGNSVSGADPEDTAEDFLNVSANRRVPIYVIAIVPKTASEVTELQNIATNSGGQYFEITEAMIDQTPSATPVAELVRAANVAIQHAFVDFADCNAAPTPSQPFGKQTEFQITSPVVGTVDLEGATDIFGASLANDKIYKVPATTPPTLVPQLSNVMLTTAFALPGFEGKLRAQRLYKPILDDTKQSGWRFEKDGTKLWVASAPVATSRNIYTVTPFGTMMAFDSSNASTLATYMNSTEADAIRTIDYIRGLPLGAFVGSTPAVMNPPSIDPPPDVDYPGFITANTERRTLIWIGGNDGMMHAIDARTGTEVFAFIPFNLLPKLRALLDGQAVGNFDFFVDASPKLADVRVSSTVASCPSSLSTCWRTYLFFGQGPGGTFFQALDVTLDDMSPAVTPTGPLADVISYFSTANRVIFRWSFPSYQDFDYTLAPYGDIKASAPAISKTVGETWSDPAVGQIKSATGKFALLTGSGFFPKSKQDATNRGGAIAGTTFYLLNIDDGTVFHSKNVGSDGLAEDVDNCVTANNCAKFKNALQADVVATGPSDTRYVTKGYVGDLDGNVWRFDIDMVSGVPQITTTTKLYAAGAAHPLFASMATVHIGATQAYVFFGTGSDLLPSNGLPANHQYKLMSLLDQGTSGVVKYTELLQKVDGAGNDEKITGFPAVAGDIVFFVTTLTKPSTPCVLPDAAVYAATFTGGQGYIPTGTNAGNAILTLTGGRVTAPFIADQHVAFGFGDKLELLGDPKDFNNGVGQVGVRILSWRDTR